MTVVRIAILRASVAWIAGVVSTPRAARAGLARMPPRTHRLFFELQPVQQAACNVTNALQQGLAFLRERGDRGVVAGARARAEGGGGASERQLVDGLHHSNTLILVIVQGHAQDGHSVEPVVAAIV